MTRTRITGSTFTAERLDITGHIAMTAAAVFDGDREIGIIEYVRLPNRSGGSTYGWRPKLSGWTASRLTTKLRAAKALR